MSANARTRAAVPAASNEPNGKASRASRVADGDSPARQTTCCAPRTYRAEGFDITISQTSRRILRALVALVLVAWLANRVGVRAIYDEFERAQFSTVLLATLLLAVDSVAKACNWQQLLQRNIGDRWVPISRVLVWFFAGGFI